MKFELNVRDIVFTEEKYTNYNLYLKEVQDNMRNELLELFLELPFYKKMLYSFDKMNPKYNYFYWLFETEFDMDIDLFLNGLEELNKSKLIGKEIYENQGKDVFVEVGDLYYMLFNFITVERR